MKSIIAFIICSISLFSFSQEATFKDANTLYNNGKYNEAIDSYMHILETKTHSAELYFNLGNAHYKLNNIAPSIYYYEKALQLNPNDKDIQNNIAFARNMTIDAIDTVPEVGFSKIIKSVVNAAKADTWAKIAVISVFCFVILFLIYYFSFRTIIKRIAFITSVLSIGLLIFSVIMAYQKSLIDSKNNPAIVFASETRAKTDPNKSSEEVFRLHEGTKVQVLETYEDWTKIQLSDNTAGWIPSQDIKLLNIF